ncbi:MAG: Gfo/Idh/MocA family oxidoreductase [Acidobacteria bacterium]|nr:Gfo/Idh/MocA family oxidoreductase [Acidobacteriota bacterium]
MIPRRAILTTPLLLAAQEAKFRIAVLGTEHGHVRGFLNAAKLRQDVEIIGPVSFEDRNKLRTEKAEAIASFTSTDRHLECARLAADLKLPLMMEKPLATTNEDARQIAKLSAAAGIPIIVNFETTWYKSHGELWRFFKEQNAAGKIRKMLAMDGHQGPREIGVGNDFFEWLTDPVRNGAGALFDFGCYGANLMTWMMDNQRPLRVMASTKQNKPQIYAKVDDEATIVVEYESAQGIIEGSWNWPFSRKDFEVYGEKAYAHAYGGNSVRRRKAGEKTEETFAPVDLKADEADSISYLKAIARGKLKPGGLSSLENNVIATEILVAARQSAKTGKQVKLR